MALDYRKTFDEILLPYLNQDNSDINELSTILQKIKDETKGQVIIDFMDHGSWDCFESFDVDSKKGTIQIIWHDFSTRQEDPLSKEMRQMTFPADLYGLFAHFQSFRAIPFQNTTLLLVRSYALEEKDIKVNLQPRTQTFEIFDRDNNAFSKRIFRKVKGNIEWIHAISTHLFSIAILPKGLRVGTDVSTKLLEIIPI